MSRPRIVLDTNVLLVSISRRSRYHWVFRAIVERRISLCLTTEIALEYEEIITRHMGASAAADVLEAVESAPDTVWMRSPYRWHLIPADPDDDKFVDCSVAAGATIVTEDRHFDALEEDGFPPVRVIGVEDLRRLLEGEGVDR